MICSISNQITAILKSKALLARQTLIKVAQNPNIYLLMAAGSETVQYLMPSKKVSAGT